jgi:hypothetical protein
MTTAQARTLVACAHQRTDETISETIATVRYRQQRNYAAYRSHRKRTLKRHRRYQAVAHKKRPKTVSLVVILGRATKIRSADNLLPKN